MYCSASAAWKLAHRPCGHMSLVTSVIQALRTAVCVAPCAVRGKRHAGWRHSCQTADTVYSWPWFMHKRSGVACLVSLVQFALQRTQAGATGTMPFAEPQQIARKRELRPKFGRAPSLSANLECRKGMAHKLTCPDPPQLRGDLCRLCRQPLTLLLATRPIRPHACADQHIYPYIMILRASEGWRWQGNSLHHQGPMGRASGSGSLPWLPWSESQH